MQLCRRPIAAKPAKLRGHLVRHILALGDLKLASILGRIFELAPLR